MWLTICLTAPVVTTTSITLINKIQNWDILAPADQVPPGKWLLKLRERETGRERETERLAQKWPPLHSYRRRLDVLLDAVKKSTSHHLACYKCTQTQLHSIVICISVVSVFPNFNAYRSMTVRDVRKRFF